MFRKTKISRGTFLGRLGLAYTTMTGLGATLSAEPTEPLTTTTRPVVRNKDMLDALTPDKVLQKLKQGNERFVLNVKKNRDHLSAVQHTSDGQYPIAAVVGCMDSRASSTLIFDQGIGDLFTIGIAGNIVNDDILGSLEYACKVIGSKVLLVMGHTDCGAVKGAIDNVELGNLTDLLEKIQPAKDSVPDSVQPRTSQNKAFVTAVAQANVVRMIAEIRERSPILHTLDKNGTIKIVGAMYDVATGRVTYLS